MIAIIDYGVGNLRSVEKAFQYIGYEAIVTSDPYLVMSADAVVLPGVGAFADAMKQLKQAGMVEAVKLVVKQNKPFLGICLGMQMLFEYSEEGGECVPGLGIFKGEIKLLPQDLGLKIPHMGWNKLRIAPDCLLFNGLSNEPYVYFVHSYYLTAKERDMVIASSSYGIEFDVAVGKGKIYATQFHPEKSGDVGLQILRNWVKMI